MVGTDGIAGNALIEFAIIAPLLVVMCVYVIDFGFLLPSPDGIATMPRRWAPNTQ